MVTIVPSPETSHRTPEALGIRSEYLEPIPLELPSVAGWKEIPVENDPNDVLVPLGSLSPEFKDVYTSSIYAGERTDSPYNGEDRLGGALETIFVRRSVACKLKLAQAYLPPNLKLAVFDAYRPLEVQQSLYDHYYASLQRLQPDWTDEELSAETQKYVSIPSQNETRPSPHNTGGAVDLAIIQVPDEELERLAEYDSWLTRFSPANHWEIDAKKARLLSERTKLLNFGTPFDFGGTEAALNYYEVLAQERPLSESEIEARNNRRLLYNLMKKVGLEPYTDEWWHYNAPESQMGAKTAGKRIATFGKAVLTAENLAFEEHRKRINKGKVSALPTAAIISAVAS